MIARITKIISKNYRILTEENEYFDAIVMGKVRRQDAPVAGDLVECEKIDGRWVIQKIIPRKNRLIRPAVANVDQALIVMSVKDPDFSTALIDRLSILIMEAGVEPVLIITKCDLGYDDNVAKKIQEYKDGSMKVIQTAKGSFDASIASLLTGKISVLTGQSGAGKSTLLNQLEPSFHLATQEISKALGRGKHTTRHNELHEVAGGLVADTPGFSSLDFSHISAGNLAEYVPDFKPYLHACKFNDCIHQNEPGCKIKEAVEQGLICQERYTNYISVLQLIQDRREKYL